MVIARLRFLSRASRQRGLGLLLALLLVGPLPIAIRAVADGPIDQAYFAGLHWRSIGPPRSGYVSAPAGVPGDSTTYYAGMPEGGVWKTTNGGTTWTPIFDDVHVASVGAVAVAPSDPNIVYVGTGNQTGWAFTAGKGVYKSTDAGKTWTNIGLPASLYIGGIVVDPHHAETVLVAAMGQRPAPARGGPPGTAARPAVAASAHGEPEEPEEDEDADAPEGPEPIAGAEESSERGIYRSTDGGKTWARVLPTDGSAGASDIYQDSREPQIVFALLMSAPEGAPPGPGAYKSTDGGVTWTALAGKGLPDGARMQAFAMSAGTHGRRLYAVAGTGRGPGSTRGLYRSDDGGETWTLGTRQLASAGGKIYADPQNPDVVYLMGTAIYKSTDAGQHVAAFWGAPSGADPRYLWIDPTNNKRMMAGVDQGAALSVDGGASWTPYYGIPNGQFYRVSTTYDVPYHVCGPQQDSGTACVASRSDFGEIRPNDWFTAGGFENGFLIADPVDHRYMYTQGWYHVLRRFDRTTGQVTVLYQPTNEERFGGAPPLAFSPKDPRTMYMAAQYVLASTDRGATWRAISPDLAAPKGVELPTAPAATGVGAAAPGGSIQSLAVSAVASGVIWVGTSTGFIHVTRDAGKAWTNVTPAKLPPSGINVIDASHALAGTAYAALLSRDGHPHIFRTSDYGAAWQEISSGLRDGEVVRTVREDPVDPSIVYAGTVTGVYVSFDRGDHWQPLQLNLPATVVSDLTVHENDLVASTYGRGFWILDDVSPLRQARAVAAAHAPAFVFRSAPVSRIRWDNTQDTPLPPEMKVGDNPLEGAIVDYYLAAPADGDLTLTITDAAGHTIREYSSVAPPVDTTMPNVPEYWLAPPAVLSKTAGMHRVSWDLRYADPPALNFGYSGTMLDYREYTLNWHALPGQTPRSTLVGPMVLPGTYTATLTAGGQRYAQTITVTQDPRVTVAPTALAAQFRLQQRMVAGIAATYHGFNYVQDLRAALAARTKAGAGATPEIATAAESLDAALAPLLNGPGSFGFAHRDLGRRLNDQLIADATPSPNLIAGVDLPCQSIDTALDTVRRLQTGPVVALNALLARAGQNALPAWTAPPAPACGAK
jgi:photosystem II stability/assembly factor-like uncharacterized protein